MTSELILIIDDDEDLTRMLTDVLTTNGYEVETSDSTFGALAMVRKLHPAAVLLDLGLPFRPGSSLLTELKANPETADVPVLVVSGIPEILTDERRALAAAILSKPFQIEELLDAIRTACAQNAQDPV
jgi:DNA-binding response OmpR family regulator